MQNNIMGKEIVVFDPGISCDEDQLKQFLSTLSLTISLRKIADTAVTIDNEPGFSYVGSIPVDTHLLTCAAEYVVKYADPKLVREITHKEYDTLLRMMYCIIDAKRLRNSTNPLTLLMTLSYQHFPNQENLLSELVRCYFLFYMIWNDYISDIDVISAIKEITGVHYPILLYFTYAFYGIKEGYFWPYKEDKLAELAQRTGFAFSSNTQDKFLEWASCDLEKARQYKGSISIFQKFPIYRTSYKPIENKDEVYLKISGLQLHKKATIGIYYELSEKYAEKNGKNLFRESFGQVFQEYVGLVLREYFHTWNVNPEIKYTQNQNEHRSVDWIIWKDNKAILIEVKQNAIGYRSKVSGEHDLIQKEITRTIGKAMHQLEKTKDEIASQELIEYHMLADINEFETLIVLYDSLYNAKSISDHYLNPADYKSYNNHSIIGISDFEYFCNCQSNTESMFEILAYKRMEKIYQKEDFREYLLQMYPDNDMQVSFHAKIYNEFFSKVDKE